MNDFSVHRIIGRGGFGEVYGCRKADTGKMYVTMLHASPTRWLVFYLVAIFKVCHEMFGQEEDKDEGRRISGAQ